MKQEIAWVIIFGVVILVAGLVATVYAEEHVIFSGASYDLYGYQVEYPAVTYKTYPYQNVGILLAIAGIVLTSIGLFAYLKTETTSKESLQ